VLADIISAIGAFFAAVAAVAAWKALGLAKDSLDAAQENVRLAESARQDAEMARRDAEAQRREAVRDRRRQRLERIGEMVEEIFWQAHQEDFQWQAARNRLRQALVGLRDELPTCVALTDTAVSYDQAVASASSARAEVDAALLRLENE
jgi:hypothetical protein